MLTPDTKLAIYMHDALDKPFGKMGHGVLKYSPNEVVAVIDAMQAGKPLKTFVDCDRACPIVSHIKEAEALGAQALVLGIAPTGGHLPDSWLNDLDAAIQHGLSIINGLHDPLAPRYPHLNGKQWVWDIRQEPLNLPIASGRARTLNNKRVLFIGSDMAVGKMTAALELMHAAKQADVDAAFIATGQIGITIAGNGVPLDAIRLDYACGAIEDAVMQAGNKEMVIIEGQGALTHPGSTATLPLLRGSAPTHFVFCHRAGQKTLAKLPDIHLPPLKDLIKLYEDLAAVCGTYYRPESVGICVNTAHLGETEAAQAIAKLEAETGLPAWDVVRGDAAGLLAAIK